MIDYDATLQKFFEECIKYLDKSTKRAKDKIELQSINNAINMVLEVASNPKKYADYNARASMGFENFDMSDGFIVNGDNSVLLTYFSVVSSMGELYNKYAYQREQAQQKLLKGLKFMKYKNSGNLLKDFYFSFLTPNKFAVKMQNQK